jgi:hypothetical protein
MQTRAERKKQHPFGNGLIHYSGFIESLIKINFCHAVAEKFSFVGVSATNEKNYISANSAPRAKRAVK